MATTTALKKKESVSKTGSTLSKTEGALIDAYWRAANYLSVGQIYLFDNPLLREPLKGSTSSRGCSAIGARRRASTSSMRTSIG